MGVKMKPSKIRKTKKQKLEELLLLLLGKRFVCKYIRKTHEYKYMRSYYEGRKPYRQKVHIRACKHCGASKRIVV
ncbi:hypothetical protein MOD24_14640 [Bacillus haynesii]|uniref:hypothetical protein n=1 Tax=Bacillus haynesii TaxID=1925021 RepID=UPI000C780EC0|nr:hypothetical protein [Bacillus haynesii]MCY8577084.1 hypothetical protein [Bacillus haynesii]PLC14041.1 hypothetical protein BV582_20945 [Bacillus paralicheniformis]GIN55115.1 hypothetical protein J36TS2_40090 [Bacillus paralicheniformis]